MVCLTDNFMSGDIIYCFYLLENLAIKFTVENIGQISK